MPFLLYFDFQTTECRFSVTFNYEVKRKKFLLIKFAKFSSVGTL